MGVGSWGGASVSIHWLVFSSLLFGSPQFFMSWDDSFLASAIVGASATNHLWGAVGGERGQRDESGLWKNPLWFSRD